MATGFRRALAILPGSFARLGAGQAVPDHRPRRVLAGRRHDAQGRRSPTLRRPPASRHCAPTWPAGCPSPPSGSTPPCGPGTTSASSRCASTGWSGGTGPVCCASATPRTPCPRSRASASTSPSRTQSRRRTCSIAAAACRGAVTDAELAAVQRRRALPAVAHPAGPAAGAKADDLGFRRPESPRAPTALRCACSAEPGPLRRLFSRFLAIGVRNEHVAAPLRTGRAVQVSAVAVPATALLTGALPRVDWSDAHAVTCPAGAPTDPQAWADAIFGNPPPWVHRLITFRQAVVGLVGIDRGRPSTFATRARTHDEVLLGTDERHLSFRSSVLCRPDVIVLSTIVQLHNRRGRTYSAVVRLIHPLVVRAVLDRAARSLSSANRRAQTG